MTIRALAPTRALGHIRVRHDRCLKQLTADGGVRGSVKLLDHGPRRYHDG